MGTGTIQFHPGGISTPLNPLPSKASPDAASTIITRQVNAISPSLHAKNPLQSQTTRIADLLQTITENSQKYKLEFWRNNGGKHIFQVIDPSSRDLLRVTLLRDQINQVLLLDHEVPIAAVKPSDMPDIQTQLQGLVSRYKEERIAKETEYLIKCMNYWKPPEFPEFKYSLTKSKDIPTLVVSTKAPHIAMRFQKIDNEWQWLDGFNRLPDAKTELKKNRALNSTTTAFESDLKTIAKDLRLGTELKPSSEQQQLILKKLELLPDTLIKRLVEEGKLSRAKSQYAAV